MPNRFLLFTGPCSDLTTDRLRTLPDRIRLRKTAQDDQMMLLADDFAAPLTLPGDASFIVGPLFPRHGPARRVTTFSLDEANLVVRTSGRHLIDHYWGSYVAIIRGKSGLSVMRAPFGSLSCYYACIGSNLVLASDAPTLVGAGLKPEIDWHGIGRALYQQDFPSRATAIANIRQVLAGDGLEITSNGVREVEYWHPSNHVAPVGALTFDEHAERLGRTIRHAVAAWSSCFDRSLVGISGGLDSSIVAACLTESRRSISCLTLLTDDPVGDEREYARLIAAKADADLAEERYDIGSIDLTQSVAASIPVPCGKTHEEAYNAAVRRVAKREGSNAFFTGLGGDSVFYLTHSARPLVDQYLEHGFSGRLLQTAFDIGGITGANPWQIVREARRIHRMRKNGIQWHTNNRFLHPACVDVAQSTSLSHSWLQGSADLLPGKQGHLTTLLRAMNHLEHRDKALNIPLVSPLMAQTVIELALSIPSWEACRGGADRAVAREAFSNSLPRSILQRRDKGGPDGFVVEVVRSNLSRIRSYLLEGNLAHNAIVDRSVLDHALRAGSRLKVEDFSRIVSLIDTEAWTQHWGTMAV